MIEPYAQSVPETLPPGPYPHLVKGSVTVHIAAPAGLVWDLISDVTRALAGWARLRTNLAGMRATLERIKAVAERG